MGTIGRRAGAEYDAAQYSGLMRVGAAVPGTVAGLGLKPFGELRYSTLIRDGFDESGAGSAALAGVEALTARSLRSLAGVRAAWSSPGARLRVVPEVMAAWARESGDTQAKLSAALNGVSGLANFQRFQVLGARVARNSLMLSVGARTLVTQAGSAFISYDGETADTGSEHGFSAGFNFAW